jgi:hypothetical protein
VSVRLPPSPLSSSRSKAASTPRGGSTAAKSEVRPGPVGRSVLDGFSGPPRDGDFDLLPAAPAVPLGPSLTGELRGAGLAVSDAVSLFRAGAPVPSAFPGAEVISNPADVQLPEDRSSTPRAEAANAQVKANQELEMAALRKLPASRHPEYLAVRKALEQAKDPVAVLSLQKLLLDDALPGERAYVGSTDVLSGLHTLLTQPLASGVDRAALLTDTVQELAWPPSVAQGDRNTCAPTVVQIHLMLEHPAEHLRLLSGMASVGGRVTLRGGRELVREPGAEAQEAYARSAAQRLMSPAMMEYANGTEQYDPERDVHLDADGEETWGGLSPGQVDHLLEGIHGGEFAFADMVYGHDSQDAAWALLEEELQSGNSVIAGVRWRNGGHKVLVTGLETAEGMDWVRIVNPWGQEERLPREGFIAAMRNINYRPSPGS